MLAKTHNRLHRIVHDSAVSLADEWQGYLRELESSDAVAKTPA